MASLEHPSSTEASAAAAASAADRDGDALMLCSEVGPTLNTVPDDVLVQIFSQLDMPTDFGRTSKRFRLISQDDFFRSRWFVTRFQPYEVLFEAIARGGKMFTPELFHRLLRAGAILSRNLAQLLLAMHTPSCLTGQKHSKWGRSISFDAWIAVITEARKLYGPISLEREHLDALTFNTMLIATSPDVDKLSQLIKDFRFMPLRLSFTTLYGGSDFVSVSTNAQAMGVKQVLVRCPSLAEAICANGHSMTSEDSLWITRTIFAKSSEGASSADMLSQLQHLRAAGVAEVSREVAFNVVYGLLSKSQVHGVSTPPYLEAYLALMELYRDGSLDFDLEVVVEEIVASFRSFTFIPAMSLLLERVDNDFPSVDIASMMVQATFIKVEDEGIKDLDVIKARMGGHQVTSSDVLEACMRNTCCTTTPLQYGVKHVDGFDLEPTVRSIIDAILNQPYRGRMLSKLNSLFHDEEQIEVAASGIPLLGAVNFRALLATAVASKAFALESIPAQEWHLALRGTCNSVAPVRSMLTYHWRQQNSHAVNSDWKYNHYGEEMGLTKFTRFGPESSTAAAVLAGVPPTLTGDARLVNPRYALSYPSEESRRRIRREERAEFVRQGSNNLLGTLPLASQTEPVGSVIVEILGSESKAADVVLAHCIVNGNQSLTDNLVIQGVVPTLQHVRIAMKVGYAHKLFDSIADGARFRTSYDAPEDLPDKQLLAIKKSAKITLTQQQQSTCQAIVDSIPPPAAVLVTIDASSSVQVSGSPTTRSEPVKEIATDTPKQSPAAASATAASSRSAKAAASKVMASVPETAEDVEMADARASPTTLKPGDASTSAEAGSSGGTKRSTRAASVASSRPKRSTETRSTSVVREESTKKAMASENSGDEGEDDDVYMIDFEKGPIQLTQEQLDRRVRSLEVWCAHLSALRYLEELKNALLKKCNPAGTYILRGDAHKELNDAVPKLNQLLKALRSAKPLASNEGALLAELERLWADIDEKDGDEAKQIRSRVELLTAKKRQAKGPRRRLEFQYSPYSNTPEYTKTAEYKKGLPPLSAEDSNDEDFETPLGGNESSSCSSSESSESDLSSDDEPASKRAKTGRATRLAKPSAAKAKGKKGSTAQKGKGKARSKVVSDSEAEESDDEGDDED